MDTLDDICKACGDEKRNSGCSSTVMALKDKSYAAWYGFKIGKIYTSKQILKRINKKVSKARRVKINF